VRQSIFLHEYQANGIKNTNKSPYYLVVVNTTSEAKKKMKYMQTEISLPVQCSTAAPREDFS
jgi:hypothetical protein